MGCTGECKPAANRPQIAGLMTVSMGTLGRGGHIKWGVSRLPWADLSIFFFFDSFSGEVGELGGHISPQYRVLGPK